MCLQPPTLNTVLTFIDANLAQRLTVAMLAAVVGCSVSHFAHKFRVAVGTSPCQYVMARRVRRAVVMIAAGVPLPAVALACGFSDQPHLTRTLRRHLARTPAEIKRFRKLAQEHSRLPQPPA